MPESMDGIREHLVRVLEWEDAHVGLDRAVRNMPVERSGVLPSGFEHSAWQLLDHIRIAQEDILDFCVNVRYEHTLAWPEDYWPADPASPDANAWAASVAGCRRSREQLQDLVRQVPDLTAVVPTGKEGQTYLRAMLLAADHAAYHVGQLVAVRRALGIWPAA